MSRCAKHVLQANETALVLLQHPVPVAAAPFKRRTSLIRITVSMTPYRSKGTAAGWKDQG